MSPIFIPQTSPGRHPVSLWNSTIDLTTLDRWGKVALTISSATGPTGGASLAVVRPTLKPHTAANAV
jgi:hypothetical protein